eukprot:NODE_238_length_13323_cov_0.463854.p11 type:complete len:100 gc:universal NODE_238_length_13323_cov_0.463854:4693-4394(-)
MLSVSVRGKSTPLYSTTCWFKSISWTMKSNVFCFNTPSTLTLSGFRNFTIATLHSAIALVFTLFLCILFYPIQIFRNIGDCNGGHSTANTILTYLADAS